MSLMIHDTGFIAWHQMFFSKLELVVNSGEKFVPRRPFAQVIANSGGSDLSSNRPSEENAN